MNVLSVRQPWLHCILHETKRLENRSWRTHYRGPLLLHASKGMTEDEYDSAFWHVREHIEDGHRIAERLPQRDRLLRGGVAGIARLIACQRSPERMEQCAPWEIPGGFAWELADALALPFVPCRGSLGLWEAPADVLTALGLPALNGLHLQQWRQASPSQHIRLRMMVGLVEPRHWQLHYDQPNAYRLTELGLAVQEALCSAR